MTGPGAFPNMASPMPAAAASGVTFGARLRHGREARGVSLRQIADKTRIAVRALEALERDDIARLPGIFSRGFVRSYAAEVGVDPERAVREFLSQFPNELASVHPAAGAAAEGGVGMRFGPQVAILLGSVALGVTLILIWSFAAH